MLGILIVQYLCIMYLCVRWYAYIYIYVIVFVNYIYIYIFFFVLFVSVFIYYLLYFSLLSQIGITPFIYPFLPSTKCPDYSSHAVLQDSNYPSCP